jgi:hypothetical protein
MPPRIFCSFRTEERADPREFIPTRFLQRSCIFAATSTGKGRKTR